MNGLILYKSHIKIYIFSLMEFVHKYLNIDLDKI